MMSTCVVSDTRDAPHKGTRLHCDATMSIVDLMKRTAPGNDNMGVIVNE